MASVDLCEPNLELLWEDEIDASNVKQESGGRRRREEMNEFLAWPARFRAPLVSFPQSQYRVSGNQEQYIKTLIPARD